MIPTMTLDLTPAVAGFAWAGVAFVIAALGAILVALVRDERSKPEAETENAATLDTLRPAA